jgi:predicted outer membrane repeat protein
MRKTFILFIVVLFPSVCFSATIHVPGDYLTIQEAILAASNGDTVLVDPGTYKENINFKGKAINVMSSGGYLATVIDGDNKLLPVVRFQNAEGPSSVLCGFTITNGNGKLLPNGRAGGGIYCETASPTIKNNLITKNKADFSGGGIYCVNASPLISNNIITENHADHATEMTAGGGIALRNSSPAIMDNIISMNTATGSGDHAGGGIICHGSLSSPLISNNLISGNVANFGGGIFCSGDPAPTISNNLIFENSAVGRGGGIQFWYAAGPALVTNNTLFGNTCQGEGGGLVCNDDSVLTVTNMILWNNEAPVGPEIAIESVTEPSTLTISFSNVEGGQSSAHVLSGCTLNWGLGMIDSDPFFVDPANGDYHLTFNSPCRASGDNSAVTEPYDFEGDPRIAYGTVDMGADEFYTHLYWTGDATPGGNVEVKFVGLPGTTPVGLCLGTGVLDPPIPSMWGDWYLAFPIMGPINMGSITSPEGVLIVPGTIPGTPPPPYLIPMQALIGVELTNLSVMEVK